MADVHKDLEALRSRAALAEWEFQSHAPLVGWLVAMVRRTVHSIAGRWALRALAQQQSQFNSEIVNALEHLTVRLEHLERMSIDLDRSALTLGRQMAEMEIFQRREREAVAERLSLIEAQGELIEALQKRLSLIEAQGELIEALQKRLEALERWGEDLGTLVAGLRAGLRAREGSPSPGAAPEPSPIGPANGWPSDGGSTDGIVDYFLFEMRYRGSPDEIMRRQEQYLPYFEGAQGEVLDLGCGRGEFLKLLARRGIRARGVDLDPDMVDYCRQSGLQVEQGDLIQYLAQAEDNSLGGIFLGQVVEHLPVPVLGRLVTLAYRKLRPDAHFVAETINPVCVLALTTHYLMDPSHVRPIPPELLRFVLQCAGFGDVRVVFSSPVPHEARLKRFPAGDTLTLSEEQWLAILNENVDRLNDFLYGYQDYAVVARKFVWPERLASPAARRELIVES